MTDVEGQDQRELIAWPEGREPQYGLTLSGRFEETSVNLERARRTDQRHDPTCSSFILLL